jgi:hypothetical protein
MLSPKDSSTVLLTHPHLVVSAVKLGYRPGTGPEREWQVHAENTDICLHLQQLHFAYSQAVLAGAILWGLATHPPMCWPASIYSPGA